MSTSPKPVRNRRLAARPLHVSASSIPTPTRGQPKIARSHTTPAANTSASSAPIPRPKRTATTPAHSNIARTSTQPVKSSPTRPAPTMKSQPKKKMGREKTKELSETKKPKEVGEKVVEVGDGVVEKEHDVVNGIANDGVHAVAAEPTLTRTSSRAASPARGASPAGRTGPNPPRTRSTGAMGTTGGSTGGAHQRRTSGRMSLGHSGTGSHGGPGPSAVSPRSQQRSLSVLPQIPQGKAAELLGADSSWKDLLVKENLTLKEENTRLKAALTKREFQCDLVALCRSTLRSHFVSYLSDECLNRIGAKVDFAAEVNNGPHGLLADLDRILGHPALVVLLQDFAVHARTAESIDFLLATRTYAAATDAMRMRLGPRLVEEFVGAGAKNEVNISSGYAEEILAASREQNYSATLFDKAVKEIRMLASQNLIADFRSSPMWVLVNVVEGLEQAVPGKIAPPSSQSGSPGGRGRERRWTKILKRTSTKA